MITKLHLLFALTLVMILAAAAFAADAPKYAVTSHFAIAGDGGWDYLTFDADGARVFITRGTHVQVVDASTGKLLGDIPDTPGVHGVALDAADGIGAISEGRADTVALFDLKTLKKTVDVKTGGKPDAIIFDPFSKHVLSMDGKGNDTTVIDPIKGTVVATIPLGGGPEFAVSDLKGRVFINLEDKNELVAIDTTKNAVLAHWPLTGCDGPSGIAMDRKTNRVFSVCSNGIMTVLDAASGKLVATVPIGKHPDAAGFDPDLKLAFSSNGGDGTLTVVHEDSADKFSVVNNLATAMGARTMTVDPKSHKIYLVTAKFGAAPAATAAEPRPRPSMLPNSFEMLVVTAK